MKFTSFSASRSFFSFVAEILSNVIVRLRLNNRLISQCVLTLRNPTFQCDIYRDGQLIQLTDASSLICEMMAKPMRCSFVQVGDVLQQLARLTYFNTSGNYQDIKKIIYRFKQYDFLKSTLNYNNCGKIIICYYKTFNLLQMTHTVKM